MVWTQCDVTHWSPRSFTEKLRTHPLPDQCWAENKFRKGQISCGTLQEQGHCYLKMYTHIGNIFSALQVYSQWSSYVSATVQLFASLTVHEHDKLQSCPELDWQVVTCQPKCSHTPWWPASSSILLQNFLSFIWKDGTGKCLNTRKRAFTCKGLRITGILIYEKMTYV